MVESTDVDVALGISLCFSELHPMTPARSTGTTRIEIAVVVFIIMSWQFKIGALNVAEVDW
jgi:hypothetical protein